MFIDFYSLGSESDSINIDKSKYSKEISLERRLIRPYYFLSKLLVYGNRLSIKIRQAMKNMNL